MSEIDLQNLSKEELIQLIKDKEIDYLNQKIAQFNTNLLQRDTMFLNKVGVDQSLGVFKIEVTPIDDLYKFLNQEDKYYDIFKTLSERFVTPFCFNNFLFNNLSKKIFCLSKSSNANFSKAITD